ncbi:phosphotransferase [Profundibacterium mesophilum]|nr:phosphotransferase [Profundibacterium mesophilum]
MIEPGQIVAVGNGAFKDDVADATLKFLAPTPEGAPGFLILSGPGNPDLVARAVRSINEARSEVSPQIAAPILPAVLEGTISGMSFALWPRSRSLDEGGKVKRLIRRRLYAGAILDWNADLVRQTLLPGLAQTFQDDLHVIANDDLFPQEMRRDADRAATRLARGEWTPRHALHHGDFWSGNILLPQRGTGRAFHVIDWAGMQRRGYPFYDLARMSQSLRIGRRQHHRHVEKLRAIVDCAPRDVTSYMLSALGHIGRNLEHFPPERYRAMAIDIYGTMNAA